MIINTLLKEIPYLVVEQIEIIGMGRGKEWLQNCKSL